ncbi:sodium:proton antiporter [Clostridium estertheticum]|uniref:Na+/H+ antiporter NhaC family protein n=1 Tax=Clostridium estertheticum TaxID=238834 RepID=UPI001CF3123D|nr:Na+/H+ antiporter NhaC family protein [Clostridium estertheticum]MCB2309168.1 sodium:proton antiporter [Clostridium estertheticum]MCB2347540.1 sodium:proton antiporter [Clostridium estertheticum]MCB2352123.1 sodium:proton antiporter [Clostridium estertheticum]WAG48301.1 sodium:proton antiporter [Clostridium estertheticum]
MKESKVSEKYTFIIIALTLISIISCIILKIFLFFGFLASIVIASCLLIKNGFSTTELLNMIKKGLCECKSLFILMALIGAMVSIWMASGVVPTMLYYGLKYMQGTNFLFATFVLTSIVSIFMGTAFGTISCVGIALLGLAKIFGIPNYILLGAIVSGAFIADKISPISSLFNLTLETLKISYKEALMSILKTLLPTYFVSGSLYYFIGKKYSIVIVNSNIDNFISTINRNFVVSPLLLLLPASIIIMSFLGVKMVKAVSLALIAGIIVSIGLQKANFNDIIVAIFNGYRINTNSVDLNTVLVSGGVVSMVSIILIITGAISLSSMFQETGLLVPIIKRITLRIKSHEELILKTGFISSALTAISDQSVGIILPGKLLREKYRELGIDNTTLARTITDTGTVIAPLIPWNANSLFIFIITGIPTVSYAPYTVLCYVSPIITFIFAYLHKFKTGKQVKKVQVKNM